MFLMYKDTPVLAFDVDKNQYDILNDKLIQDDTVPQNVLDKNIQEAKEACKIKVEKKRNQTLER